MSSVIGKEFQNKTNGAVIKVVGIEGNIAVLENDQRISVERLLDGNHYGENIVSVNESSSTTDVMGGGNLHNQLFNQIQGLDSEDVNRASNHGGEAHVGEFVNPVEVHNDAQRKLQGENVYIDGADSVHQEMLAKAKQDQMTLVNKMRKQAAKVGKLVDGIEDEINIPVNRNLEGATVEGQPHRETSVSVVEDIGVSSPPVRQVVQKEIEVNPMFTKMKRTQKVSLKIDIDELVPSKDLLKMLEEGFEDSVLDYLTDEIAGKVLSDSIIKSQIRQKLHEYVYGKPRKKSPAKKTTSKKTTVKKSTTKK